MSKFFEGFGPPPKRTEGVQYGESSLERGLLGRDYEGVRRPQPLPVRLPASSAINQAGNLTVNGQQPNAPINLPKDLKINFNASQPVLAKPKTVVVPKITLTKKGKKVASKTAPLLAQAAAVNPAYKQHLDLLRKFGIIK